MGCRHSKLYDRLVECVQNIVYVSMLVYPSFTHELVTVYAHRQSVLSNLKANIYKIENRYFITGEEAVLAAARDAEFHPYLKQMSQYFGDAYP
jgi:hypothetical protein